MKDIRWDPSKSEWLRRVRGVSFEEILGCPLVVELAHPKRANQKLLLFDRNSYVWVVPAVQDERGLFLKTLYQSRKYTRIYDEKNKRTSHETDP